MIYTYHIRPAQHAQSARYHKTDARFVALTALCAGAVCALLLWVTVAICGHTQVIRADGEGRAPSNTVNMHGVHRG